MSGQPTPTGEHGPSWSDIRQEMEALMETYGGAVTIELSVAPRNRPGAPHALWVRLVHRERSDGVTGAERAAGGQWPTSEHRTMPGLLYRLAVLLERKLEDAAHDLATAAPIHAAAGGRAYLTYQDPQPTEAGG